MALVTTRTAGYASCSALGRVRVRVRVRVRERVRVRVG